MRKGFTLIELLAVIVIIAVIAVVTTPIILDIIEDSRKGSAEDSAYNTVKAVQNYFTTSQLTTEETLPLTVNFPSSDVVISGTTPTSGSVTLNANGTYSVTDLLFGSYLCNSYGVNVECYNNTALGTLRRVVEENIGSTHLTTMSVNGTSVTKVIGTKADKTTIKNWVWYSGQLWQVLETTDEYVKLVTANSVTSISYGTTNAWSSSWVRKWLNEIDGTSTQDGIYYHNLSREDLLLNGNFCLDEPSNIVITSGKVTSFTPISSCTSVSTDKIGLLTFEDYIYALNGTVSGSNGGSFLDEDERSWTMTKHLTTTLHWSTQDSSSSYLTYDTALVATTNGYGEGVRAVIYLDTDLLIRTGTDRAATDEKYGMAKNPYILTINETKTSGDYLNTVAVGSYIYISETNTPSTNTTEYVTSRISYTYDKTKVRYRVIGINADGTIKVQRSDILRGLASTIAISSNMYVPYYYINNGENTTSCAYLNSTWYYGGCTNHNYFQPTQGSGAYAYTEAENIGHYLNNTTNGFYTWLSDSVKAKITSTSLSLNVDSYGVDYVRTLFNIDTSGTYPTRINDGTVTANISLPTWGDMFSGNDINVSYWLINRASGSSASVSYVGSSGNANANYAAYTWYAVRPVFLLQSNIQISSGSGTIADPYVLGW